MPYYWAEFQKKDGDVFRFDTRIYLGDISFPKDADRCVGAVVGKNPGSAKAGNLNLSGIQAIVLEGDKFLPTVRNIVIKAYEFAGKAVDHRTYIQVLNLFYLCNPNLSAAIKANRAFQNPRICHSELRVFPWVWYVWGGKDARLSKYKLRYKNLSAFHNFFFDKNSGAVKSKKPSADDFAKHTQGLRQDDVVPYIAGLL